jgi:apolipoprotein N-acyltransferase
VVDPPLYVWWGDWFALVCTGVVAVLVVAALVRRQPRSIEFVL